jgi:hypothetical protein
MRPWPRLLLLALAAPLLLVNAAPAAAVVFEKEVPFVLGEWVDVSLTDGDVTIYRLKIDREGSMLDKAMRPGRSADFAQHVDLKIEYTNAAKKDWKAKVRAVWADADGLTIDGFDGSENLDHEESHEIGKSSLSTIKYGLDRAKTLKLRVELQPD